jgi:hypothetical protein
MHYRIHQKTSAHWHIVLLGIIFGLIVTYVWQINNQAQYSFSIRDLNDKKLSLEHDVKQLNWELHDSRSLAVIAERAEELELQQPLEITYLNIGQSHVAILEDSSLISP